jgi:molybdopterin molybdotransferase
MAYKKSVEKFGSGIKASDCRADHFLGQSACCEAAISFDEASSCLSSLVLPLENERLPIDAAAYRILSEPIVARIDAPRSDVAAMDGYAVLREETVGDSGRRVVIGEAYPHYPFEGQIGLGDAVRIFTGAQVPAKTDRIILQEDVVRIGNAILVAKTEGGKTHIRACGSDFQREEILIEAGIRLDPLALVTAAAADVATVVVRRQPRVFLLASGDELVKAGFAGATQTSIPDSIGIGLAAAVADWGGSVVGRALTADDREQLTAVSRMALAACDILVMIGGASQGVRDYARSVMTDHDIDFTFAGVAMKPGKPVWHGRVGDTHIIGLPGNPTAAITVARLFLAPLIAGLTGRSYDAGVEWVAANLGGAVPAIGNREAFLCAWWNGSCVTVIDRQTSSGQSLLARTNALVRRRINATAAVAGDVVEMVHF